MWSLGVILYILLSGMPPFYGDTEEAIFKMILRGQVCGRCCHGPGEGVLLAEGVLPAKMMSKGGPSLMRCGWQESCECSRSARRPAFLREVGSAAHQRLALRLGNKAGHGGSAGPVQDVAQQECVASLQVDLKTPPWPSISAPAKDLVLKLLNRDPVARLTAQQVRALLAACRSGWRATAALPFPHAPLPSPSSPPLQPASCAHGVAPSAQVSCSSETLRQPWTEAQALEHPWLREQGVASDKPMDSVVIARIQQFSANSRFKKAAIGVMATCLSPAELSGLEHLFQSIDADNSGTINASELRQALQSMGSKIPDDQLQARACATVCLSRV